jgi:hypothetical protein
MIDTKHLALRHIFYRAWSVYHQALAHYWMAVAHDRATADPNLVVAIRTAAATLDTALTTLLTYLSQQEPSVQSEDEHTRLARIQELLQHELALLPHE